MGFLFKMGGCPVGSVELARNNMPPTAGDSGLRESCFPGTFASYVCAPLFLVLMMVSCWALFPSTCQKGSDYLGADEDPANCVTTVIVSTTTETKSTIVTRQCNPLVWPQASFNYVSVAKNWMIKGYKPALASDHLLCPWSNERLLRSIPGRWNRQHSGWTHLHRNMDNHAWGCQRDEYPFIRFIGAPNPALQYMRL